MLCFVAKKPLPLSMEFLALSLSALRDLFALCGCSRGAYALVTSYLEHATQIVGDADTVAAFPTLLQHCRKLRDLRWAPDHWCPAQLPELVFNNAACLRRLKCLYTDDVLVALSFCSAFEHFQPTGAVVSLPCVEVFLSAGHKLRSASLLALGSVYAAMLLKQCGQCDTCDACC